MAAAVEPPRCTPPVAAPGPAARILAEGPLTLPAAARRLPPGHSGRPPAPSTLGRWIRAGVRRPADGAIVRLESARMGGAVVTSEPALGRFFEALNVPPAPVPQPAPPAAGMAEAALTRLGC